MTDISEVDADEIEQRIIDRQLEQNGPMFCPRCTLEALLCNDFEVPKMEVRYSTLSPNSRIPHEDITWKCGRCRTHMWSSVRIDESEIEREKELRGGMKYDPASDPEQQAALDRLEALGYIEGDHDA